MLYQFVSIHCFVRKVSVVVAILCSPYFSIGLVLRGRRKRVRCPAERDKPITTVIGYTGFKKFVLFGVTGLNKPFRDPLFI